MASRRKKPAQMTPALPAEGIAPGISGKPGEVGGSNSCTLTTRRKAIAAQLKNNSRRIKEGMGVRTLDLDFPVPAGHCPPACSAADGFYRADLFLVLFFFYRLTQPEIPSIHPKRVTGAICRLHGNIPQ